MTIYRTGASDLIWDHRVYAVVAPVFAAPPEPAGTADAQPALS